MQICPWEKELRIPSLIELEVLRIALHECNQTEYGGADTGR